MTNTSGNTRSKAGDRRVSRWVLVVAAIVLVRLLRKEGQLDDRMMELRLVGGIGIMNIMLASVTERTREIGVRRAIGAKRRQIVRQFLMETVVLSSLDGFLGMLFGLLIPLLITHFAGMLTIVTPVSLLLSLGISMGVGIVFGLYPAARAARLDPVATL